MKSGLYRIEVQANYLQPATDTDRTSLPEPDCCAMITHDQGITFAKLHALRIAAKPEKKDPGPCNRCIGRKATQMQIMMESGKLEMHAINYCAQCGRRLPE